MKTLSDIEKEEFDQMVSCLNKQIENFIHKMKKYTYCDVVCYSHTKNNIRYFVEWANPFPGHAEKRGYNLWTFDSHSNERHLLKNSSLDCRIAACNRFEELYRQACARQEAILVNDLKNAISSNSKLLSKMSDLLFSNNETPEDFKIFTHEGVSIET